MIDETHPDVISICTWPQHHLEIVPAATQLGVKDILCEKPMALQMSGVKEMIEICRGAGVKLTIGHQYRFHPYFIHAARMVARGALGKIVEACGNIKDSVANNGPHLLETIRLVLGDRPVQRIRRHSSVPATSRTAAGPSKTARAARSRSPTVSWQRWRSAISRRPFFDIEIVGSPEARLFHSIFRRTLQAYFIGHERPFIDTATATLGDTLRCLGLSRGDSRTK